MAKNDRMEFYRQGMLRAYKLAKDDGIDALEKELRLPVALYYIEDYRIREVAKILELPESAIKVRLAKARRKLRKLLDGEEERA